MKQLFITLCAALLIIAPVATSTAQTTHRNTNTRSEQFILDSLNNRLEMLRLEQQYEMYSDSLTNAQMRESARQDTYEEMAEYSIPLIFFGTIILIVWISLNASYRKKKEHYRILEIAIENGRELPEGFFNEPAKQKKSWLNTLRNGTATLGTGIGLIILGYIIDEEIFTGIACIPAFIGLGYLLVAWLEYREEKRLENIDKVTTECIEDKCNDPA